MKRVFSSLTQLLLGEPITGIRTSICLLGDGKEVEELNTIQTIFVGNFLFASSRKRLIWWGKSHQGSITLTHSMAQ